MNADRLQQHIDALWETSILPVLVDYIRIPAKSPQFDAGWREHGYLDDAISLTREWCDAAPVKGLRTEVLQLDNRTPLLLVEVPAFGDPSGESSVLFYGHLDKQPEMSGWDADLGPWKPVVRDNRLYGRGGADDGYAAFASIAALAALQAQEIPHPRCLVLIETCEESGSYDLPPYMDLLRDRIGKPALVVGLDSGCGNYERLWCTTSLRGVVNGVLRVDVLEEGVHSGDASGIVPSSFRILRRLLDRLEDAETGRIIPQALHADIPPAHREYAASTARNLGPELPRRFPFLDGVRAVDQDPLELLLNRSWRPALSVTGAAGLPAVEDAGNVLRPYTEVKLSLRVPPTIAGASAGREMTRLLEADPPYGARVSFHFEQTSTGWVAPPFEPWLESALRRASRRFYSAPPGYLGEGVTIPFMSMLGEQYPDSQILIAGVLGPASNAHGPNEFLHLPMVKKLTACLASIVADSAGSGTASP